MCQLISVGAKFSLLHWENTHLRLFDDRVLRMEFGPKREEVIVGWEKFHSEELHDLYPQPKECKLEEEDELGETCDMHERY